MSDLIRLDDLVITPIGTSSACRLFIDLNRIIHSNSVGWLYHMNHILLVEKYALLINERLGCPIDPNALSIASLAHDTFKEKSLNVDQEVFYGESPIPQDNNQYVRSNLDILAEYYLDDYFNTSVQLHSLAVGIWMIKELQFDQHEILYPIFFHSCPIIDVYQNLPHDVQTAIDVIMLADKLSSNYLKINLLEKPVRCDLDQIVFGNSGREFNYSVGLAVARMIGVGKSTEPYGMRSLQYYMDRARAVNPFMPKRFSIKMLGGNKQWAKRESQVFQMQ